MHSRYTAVSQHRDPWWIGWIEEIPGVTCRQPTREALPKSLRVTVNEAIDRNREQALREAGPGCAEERIAV